MKIIKCGSHVTIQCGKIEGEITGISIRYEAVSYEVTYYFNGDYKTVWMHESAIHVCGESSNQRIGFKS